MISIDKPYILNKSPKQIFEDEYLDGYIDSQEEKFQYKGDLKIAKKILKESPKQIDFNEICHRFDELIISFDKLKEGASFTLKYYKTDTAIKYVIEKTIMKNNWWFIIFDIVPLKEKNKSPKQKLLMTFEECDNGITNVYFGHFFFETLSENYKYQIHVFFPLCKQKFLKTLCSYFEKEYNKEYTRFNNA